MKKLFISRFLIWVFSIVLVMGVSSCKTGEGCQAEEKVHTKLNKKGTPKKKAKSGLFPKKMKKKNR